MALSLVAGLPVDGYAQSSDGDAVEIQMSRRIYMAPADLQVTIAIEPDQENRAFRVELDGALMYRASTVPLEGDRASRLHTVAYRSVPQGEYALSVIVFDASGERARDFGRIVVRGLP